MPVYAIIPEFQQFLDANGNPLSGGRIETYIAGTNTPKATFTESDGSTPNPTSLVLNASGYPPNAVYGSTGPYKIILKDAAGNTLRTRDYVSGANDVSAIVSEWVPPLGGATFVSATSFSVQANQTSFFHPGRRIRAQTDSAVVYGTVVSSAFTTITTVVVLLDSGALDNTLVSVEYGVTSAVNTSAPATVKSLHRFSSNLVSATVGLGSTPSGTTGTLVIDVPVAGRVAVFASGQINTAASTLGISFGLSRVFSARLTNGASVSDRVIASQVGTGDSVETSGKPSIAANANVPWAATWNGAILPGVNTLSLNFFRTGVADGVGHSFTTDEFYLIYTPT